MAFKTAFETGSTLAWESVKHSHMTYAQVIELAHQKNPYKSETKRTEYIDGVKHMLTIFVNHGTIEGPVQHTDNYRFEVRTHDDGYIMDGFNYTGMTDEEYKKEVTSLTGDIMCGQTVACDIHIFVSDGTFEDDMTCIDVITIRPLPQTVNAAHLDFDESSDDEPEIPYEVAYGGGPYAEDYTDVVDYHSDMLDRAESVAEYNATLSHVHAVAHDATSQPDIADIVSDSDRFMKLFHSSTYGKYPRPVPIKVRRVDWDGGYFDTAYCFETLEEATTWGDALLGPRDQGYMRYYVMDGDNNTLHVGIYTPAQVPPVPPVPSLEEDDVPYHVTYSNGPTPAHEHDTIPLHDADTGLELTGLDPIWHDDWGYGEVTVNGVRTLYTIETGGMDNYNPFEYGYINLDWLKRKPQPAQVDTRSFIHPEHDVPPFTVTLTDWEDQETSETFLDYPMAFKYADTIMDAYHFHYCRITNAQGYECYAHYFTEQDPF
jgi:hypothetical protein